MTRKSSPLTDLLVSIVIPSIILMKFSGADDLGARGALIVALAFPVALGLYELIRFRITNYIALLGLISVLLTGGIGLLELDAQWLAVKEAAIPALLGIAVLVSIQLRRPLIRVLMYNPKIFDTEKITDILSERGHLETFENRLLNATYFLSATFFFSALMNYLLATWIVTSPSGTAAFNEELGCNSNSVDGHDAAHFLFPVA
jgi:intracellular septation protein A